MLLTNPIEMLSLLKEPEFMLAAQPRKPAFQKQIDFFLATAESRKLLLREPQCASIMQSPFREKNLLSFIF